jgi:hypothetical protein
VLWTGGFGLFEKETDTEGMLRGWDIVVRVTEGDETVVCCGGARLGAWEVPMSWGVGGRGFRPAS